MWKTPAVNRRQTVLLLFSLFTLALRVEAQSVAPGTLPPCAARPTRLDLPPVDPALYCLERVVTASDAGELAFTGLATTPDGTLYAARPLHGEVLALVDTDTDGLPDTASTILSGLDRPNALAFDAGWLYIAGGASVYRWQAATATLETLIDDLPAESGFWHGGIAIAADDTLYLGTGAACTHCATTGEPGATLSGAILRFSDGSRQVIAMGIRQPAGLALWRDALWFTDTAAPTTEPTNLDKLNRLSIEPKFLVSADYTTILPALTFPTGSTPLALAAYDSATLPDVTGSLLVILSGSSSLSRLQGYELGIVRVNAAGEPAYTRLIPQIEHYNEQYQGRGFYPHHLYGVTSSPEGWIYFSMGGGSIYALRPAGD